MSLKIALSVEILSQKPSSSLARMLLLTKWCFNLWKRSNSNILEKPVNKKIGLPFDTCDLSPFLKHGFIIAHFRQFGKIPQINDLLEM